MPRTARDSVARTGVCLGSIACLGTVRARLTPQIVRGSARQPAGTVGSHHGGGTRERGMGNTAQDWRTRKWSGCFSVRLQH